MCPIFYPNPNDIHVQQIEGTFYAERKWNDKKKRYKKVFDEDEDEYVILGSGSFGIVYQMIDQQTKKNVAVKHVNLKSFKESERRNMMQRMARAKEAMKKCVHPNIVKLLDYYTKGATEHFIVMELCEGGSLERFLAANKGPLKQQSVRKFAVQQSVRKFAVQIKDALLHLHSHDITHRNLTPYKILMSQQSENAVLKIGSFITSQFKKGDDVTAHQTGIGQSNYSAPEVLAKDGQATPDAYRSNGNVSLNLCLYPLFIQCAVIFGQWNPNMFSMFTICPLSLYCLYSLSGPLVFRNNPVSAVDERHSVQGTKKQDAVTSYHGDGNQLARYSC